jgi:hypothetical protein
MDMHMDPVTPGGLPVAAEEEKEQQHLKQPQQSEQQQQAEQQQQQTELTDTIKTGLEAMSGRRQEIHAKVCMRRVNQSAAEEGHAALCGQSGQAYMDLAHGSACSMSHACWGAVHPAQPAGCSADR